MDAIPNKGEGAASSVYTGPDFDDSEMTFKEARDEVQKQCRSVCSLDFLKRKFPVVTWLPKYTLSNLVSDFLAGLTVGMTAIPQGLAYAEVAGLPAQYGLYSGFMGAFVYIILGSCKDITIGPTAILALMSQKAVLANGEDFAVLLCFLSGSIIFLLGILNLGFLVNFISMPVTVGFTTAAAITIASAQVKGLLGLSGPSNAFLESWINVFNKIGKTCHWDAVLGVSTIIVLLLGKYLSKAHIKRENLRLWENIFNKTIWLLSVGRNAIVAVIGTALGYYFCSDGHGPFEITGDIGKGLPPFEPPPFSSDRNGTLLTFGDMIEELGVTTITIPLISVLESVAIAKAFSKGKAIDATQEMIALGVCNIAGSFVHSMPTTGSFTRTAVNNASGVRTPFGGFFTGGLVLLALGFLTSTFQYIPKATLAAIIITAMFFMVEYEVVPLLWKSRKIDLFPFIVTVLVCLFWGLEYGIICGIAANLLFILYDAAKPRLSIQSLKILSHDVLLVTPDYSVVFPAAESFRGAVIKKCLSLDTQPVVIIDGHYMRHIDSTVAKALESLRDDLKVREQKILLWNWNKISQATINGTDPKLAELFRYESTLEQIFRENTTSESVQNGRLSSGGDDHAISVS